MIINNERTILCKKIVCGSVGSILFFLILTLSALIQSSLAVRYLSHFEAGVWFIFLNISSLLIFCDFGLSSALSREIGFIISKEDADKRIKTLFITVKDIVKVVSFIILILGAIIGNLYLYEILDAAIIYKLLCAFNIFIATIFFRFLTNPYISVIYGTNHVFSERIIRSFGPLVGVIAAFFAINMGWGIVGLSFALFVQGITTFLISKIASRNFLIFKGEISFSKEVAKKFLNPCWQWTIANLGTLLSLQSGSLIIAYIEGASFVPKYAVLLQIATAIYALSSLFEAAVIPILSKCHGEGSNDLANKITFESVKINVAIAIMLSVYFVFFIKYFVSIWVGPKFYIDKSILYLLLAVVVLSAHHQAIAVVSMSRNYVKFGIINIVGGVLNVIFSSYFVLKYGAIGAAMGLFFSQLLTVNWRVVHKGINYINIGLVKYYKKVVFPLLVFGGSLFLVSFWLKIILLDYINNFLYITVLGAIMVFLIAIFLAAGVLFPKTARAFFKRLK